MELIRHPDDPDYWIGIDHPTMMRDIRQDAARDAWYYARHVERWERRYGKPYPEPETQLSTWVGVTFHK